MSSHNFGTCIDGASLTWFCRSRGFVEAVANDAFGTGIFRQSAFRIWTAH